MNAPKINYQSALEATLKGLEGTPTLLVHSCCAPCSSYVLEYLSEYFRITVFYYNPNISPKEEYEKRADELQRLVSEMHFKNPVTVCIGPYEPERFAAIAKGLEQAPEGGERCEKCFELRLSEAARVARDGKFDYFTTSLTISPLKNAVLLNKIGEACGKAAGVSFLPSDFKKKGGYMRSIELSKEYGLYRQDYCGCAFSKAERDRRRCPEDDGIIK